MNDAADPLNTGILADELVAPATDMRYVRRVTFINPAHGEIWQVLTNEMLRMEHGITNEAEDRRRAKRLTEEKAPEIDHGDGRILVLEYT